MTSMLRELVRRLDPTDLATLDASTRLHTRKDRKYVVDPGVLATMLGDLPDDTLVLDIDGRRWFTYESTYFDTSELDSYRLNATGRPGRFKVRIRTYHETGTTVVEVKTKDARGRTVKHRRSVERHHGYDLDRVAREFAARFDRVSPYTSELRPVLTTRYQRATLVSPGRTSRATIDCGLECTDRDGGRTGLPGAVILETKSAGQPTPLDRLLWRSGHRPVKISKYATGLAALHPELPANRWYPVLTRHFGRRSEIGSSGSHSQLTGSAANM